MTSWDLIGNLLLIFIGITFSGAYYTKIVLRYKDATVDMVIIWLLWSSLGFAQSVYGAYNILTAASLPVI